MSLSVTYRAEDKAGNITTKRVMVYLVDTTGEECETGKVRFISEEYLDTLAENSIWRTKEYAQKLAKALNNKKTGEEYKSNANSKSIWNKTGAKARQRRLGACTGSMEIYA